MKFENENEQTAPSIAAQKAKKVKMRPAYTLVEIAFAVILVGAIAYAAYQGFMKLNDSTKSKAQHELVVSVIAGVERAKDSNGNVYLVAANKKMSDASMVRLANEMGGTQGIRDVQDWTYTCATGSNQTLTITTTNYESTIIQQNVINKINSSNAPWTAAASGSAITITRPNVVCR